MSQPTTLEPASRGNLGARRPQLVLAVILTCQLMIMLDATVVNIALPSIKSSLGFSTENLSWVLNAYTLTFGGLLLLGARAGDILGRRTTFVWGLALFTAASLFGGFAQTSGELLIARAVQGAGGALASPASLALLMSMYKDGRERTRAVGLYTAVSVGGGALGLIAGGILVQYASWRWVFFVNVPIGIVEIALGRLVLPETIRVRGVFDFLGAVTSTIGMASLVYAFVRAATDGWTNPETAAAFAVGIVLLTAFVLNERRAASPITPLRLFADRNRATAYLGRLFLVAGMTGMMFFLSQFLQNILHYSPIKTGAAFVPTTIVIFVSSQLTSKVIIERVGAKPTMITGIALSALGLLCFTQLSATSNLATIALPMLLIGVGNGLGFVPLTTVALSGVEPEDSGAASGMVNAMQQVGGSLGLSILITVFGTASRHAAATAPAGLSPQALATHIFVVGASRAFAVATLFLIGTLLLVIFAIRDIPKQGHPTLEEELIDDLGTAGAISATASG